MTAKLVWRGTMRVALFSALLMVLSACGGESGGGTVNGNQGPGTSDDDGYLMIAAGGERHLQGELTHQVPVAVYLVDRASGDPVSNQEVRFTILVEEDDETAAGLSLSGANAFTNSQGRASVDMYLGNDLGTWLVEATHPRSNDVVFEVEALPTETGTIAVEVINASPSIMNLGDVDLRLYREDRFECNDFRPFGYQQDDVSIETAYTPFTESTVEFEGLSTRNRYVVTAVARGDFGQIAAGGCVGSLVVHNEETTNVDLLLQLIPLNPTGKYDVISHWDFTDAIADSGVVGDIIIRVLNVFENPGMAIYDEIINLIGNLVGGLISATLDAFLSATNLDTAFQNMINNFIANNSVLSQIWEAGQDLRNVVANLQVHSELYIGKLASNYEFRGQDNWIGLTLYWTWGCEPSDGPDCGAIELVPDADGTFPGLGVLSSEWTGRVVAYDQLQIDQHTVSLRYGRLIMYVINDVILPAVTNGNANSMSEAFAYWLGCGNLVDSLMPSGELCAFDYCLQAQTVENFCDAAVSTLFGFADILINSLEFDMGLSLGGSGRLVEETSDGIVDRITNGHFMGVVTGDGGQQSSPFEATWEGVRSAPPEID